MAKKKVKDAPKATQSKAATQGIKERLEEKPIDEPINLTKVERLTKTYIKKRSEEMIDYRAGLGIEQKWQEADEEYIPHELDFGTTRKRFETDQDSGLRSRMVPVGDATQQWRSAASAPTLLGKIQIALSLIIDQMPEADLVPLEKKFEATTDLAYSLWKRNWSITDARENLKLVIFDLMKYGWAAQRTFPRKIKYNKRVRIEMDAENPENDKYEDKELVWFNDVDREPLNVYTSWIDELARPYDPFSVNESYYEMDYSYDQAKVEFGQYPNFKHVPKSAQMIRNTGSRKNNRQEPNDKMKKRQDIVTIGFFESRHKDLYSIYVPSIGLPLYISPLPNDDGYLSITHTLWILRKSSMPYGVSLWEIVRQNKQLYDKMKNMSMDQLVLSIMKFGFFSGTNTSLADGTMSIIPGQARQLTSSTGKPEVDWMEIPGPGEEAWKGLEYLDGEMDTDTGIGPTLEGELGGQSKTLGEHKLALEAQLKRLKVPVDNIAYFIDQDAYLTLSWMSQLYSIPNIQEFASTDELQDYNKENGVTHYSLFGEQTENADGTTSINGPYKAHYLPQLALHLENGEGGLKRSKESKFFQVGKDIQPKDMKWRGIFKTRPRSIIDTSQELAKATKMDMANMLLPLLQLPPEIAARPAEQMVKINEEDPKDWLPDSFLDYLKNGAPPTPPPAVQPSVSVAYKDASPALKAVIEQDLGVKPQQPPQGQAPDGMVAPPGQSNGGGQIPPQGAGQPVPQATTGQTLQNAVGMTPQQAPKVVPATNTGSFNRRL